MEGPVIDAAFFPYIIDLIFDYAPLPSLMALRVSKAWRERAEKQFAYHVVITETASESTESETTYRLGVAGKGDLGSIKTNRFETNPLDIVPAFLRHALVIDLQMSAFKYRTKRVLQHCPPRLTYRCHGFCDLSELSTMRPGCVVLFAEEIAHSPTPSVQQFGDYGLHSLQGTKKVVLHLRVPGKLRRDISQLGSFGWIGELVIVVHPWALSQGEVPFDDSAESIRMFLCFKLGLLISLVLMGWNSGVPVTVVDFYFPSFEGIPPALGSMETNLTNWLLRMCQDETVQELLYDSTEPYLDLEEDTPGLRFLSRHEYCDEVGIPQYLIEMNPDLLTRHRYSLLH